MKCMLSLKTVCDWEKKMFERGQPGGKLHVISTERAKQGNCDGLTIEVVCGWIRFLPFSYTCENLYALDSLYHLDSTLA